MAPTAQIDSGQRSRSSKIHGVRRTTAAAQLATAQKNWGEVPTMTSNLPSRHERKRAVGTNET
jgi:hypothetical protein